MRFEEGKRYVTGGKTYFILDGCARELLGASESNLFSNELNVHPLADDFFWRNDWHVYLEIASDTHIVQVSGESNFWLLINSQRREIASQEIFDEYDFDLGQVREISVA